MTRERCPVCGASDLDELIVLEDYPMAGNGVVRAEEAQNVPRGLLSIGVCHVCGTLFQMESPEPEDLQAMLLRQPLPIPQKITGMEVQETDRFLNHLRRLMPDKGRVLQIGCGTGEVMEKIRNWGFDVAGIDAHPKAVEIAQGLGFEVMEGRFDEGMFEEESFDVVVCRSVLEHMIEPVQMLSVMENILKPGGILALEVPNIEHVFRRGAFGGFAFYHTTYWTAPTLRYAVSLQGLAVDSTYETAYLGLFAEKPDKNEEYTEPIPPATEDVETIIEDADQFLDRKDRLAEELVDEIHEHFQNGVTIFGAGTPTVDLIYYTGLESEVNQVVTSDKTRHGAVLAGTEYEIGPVEEHLEPGDNRAILISSERRQDELLDRLDEYQTGGGRVMRFAPDLEVI
ncbi:methyltransferase domain-containing protein [bacterium]|nr:methyltransferase domain-containing protein [bacterium]